MKMHQLLTVLTAASGLMAPLARAQDTAALPLAAQALAGFDHPVALATLDDLRGGAAVRNDMDLNGVTSGNSAFQVQTGNNTIDAGSFAHMSGLPVVIQNSGANVLIQNATIVNLQMN